MDINQWKFLQFIICIIVISVYELIMKNDHLELRIYYFSFGCFIMILQDYLQRNKND